MRRAEGHDSLRGDKKPPPVLSFKIGNLNSSTDFSETLNIRQYLAERSVSPVVYELYGVIIYRGDMNQGNGHYLSACKAPNGQWNVYNDRDVTQVDIKDVLELLPYSLFYRRNKSLDEGYKEEARRDSKSYEIRKRNMEEKIDRQWSGINRSSYTRLDQKLPTSSEINNFTEKVIPNNNTLFESNNFQTRVDPELSTVHRKSNNMNKNNK